MYIKTTIFSIIEKTTLPHGIVEPQACPEIVRLPIVEDCTSNFMSSILAPASIFCEYAA
jgi:hypothetical protein